MSTNIPVLTQKNMAERGYPVFVVICPKCLEKWEELVIDSRPPTLCLGCKVAPVEWVTFDKMRRIAEIDLMPTKLFLAYLKLLGLDCIKNNKIIYAQYLASTVCDFEQMLFDNDGEGIEGSPNKDWTVEDMKEVFNPGEVIMHPHFEGKEETGK